MFDIDDDPFLMVPCSSCGKKFAWEPSMFKLCDDCLIKYEEAQMKAEQEDAR